jgi:hypothetical protein
VDFTYADFITNVAVLILNEATEEPLATGWDENDEKELVLSSYPPLHSIQAGAMGQREIESCCNIMVHLLSERSKVCNSIALWMREEELAFRC